MNRNRQPEGIPTGGQWATESKTEADVQLDSPRALDAIETSYRSACRRAHLNAVVPFLDMVRSRGNIPDEYLAAMNSNDIARFYDAQVGKIVDRVEDKIASLRSGKHDAIASARAAGSPALVEVLGIIADREGKAAKNLGAVNEKWAHTLDQMFIESRGYDFEDHMVDTFDELFEDNFADGAVPRVRAERNSEQQALGAVAAMTPRGVRAPLTYAPGTFEEIQRQTDEFAAEYSHELGALAPNEAWQLGRDMADERNSTTRGTFDWAGSQLMDRLRESAARLGPLRLKDTPQGLVLDS